MIFDENQVVFDLHKYEFLYPIYVKIIQEMIDGDLPLHSAVRSGKLHVSQYMMENLEEKNPRNDNGEAPLHMAAEYGYLKTVLSKKQSRMDSTSFFCCFWPYGCLQVVYGDF